MAKDKKKKKDKKSGKNGGSTATDTLKALAQNPMVADIVAAALVATASALKDSRRAQALATEAGDELAKLSKAGAKSGEALWDMALQIGRRSIEALVTGDEKPRRSKSTKAEAEPKARPRSAAKKSSTAKKANKKKQPARASSRQA